MIARERLHCKMNSLMALQVVVPIEALWTLVTFERSVLRRRLLRRRIPLRAIHRVGCIATVEVHWEEACIHVSNHGHVCPRTMEVRHDRSGHRWQ